MKRVLKLTPIGGNVWRSKLETVDGGQFVIVVLAASLPEDWEKSMQTPDAA